MSQALPNQNHPPIDVDDSYRRVSATDPSRPSEWVRRKVLAHASQVVAERSVRDSAAARAPKSTSTPTADVKITSQPPSRLALFGAIGAVALVVILGAWHFSSPRATPATAAGAVNAGPEVTPTRTEQTPPLVASATEPSTPGATASTPTSSAQPAGPSATRSAPAQESPDARSPQSTGLPNATSRLHASRSESPSPAAPAPVTRGGKQAPLASAVTARNQAAAINSASGAQQGTATAQNNGASSGSADTAARRPTAGPASVPPNPPSAARNDALVAQAATAPPAVAAPAVTSPPPVAAAQAPAVAAAASPPPSTQTPTSSPDALWRAAEAGDIRGVNVALDSNVNINARDAEGRTALMLATVHGQAGAVKALLARGADASIPDARNHTPLYAANAGGQSLIVVILKHSGAK